MPTPIKKGLFVYCPKSGQMIGINWSRRILWFLFPALGFLALLWILFRVIPKPSRANYPCVRAAAPLALSFLGYVLSVGFIAVFLRKTAKALSNYRYSLAFNCIVIAGFGLLIYLNFSSEQSLGAFIPSDAPNMPIGTAKGTYPGRVVWVHDPAATSWDGINGSWRSDVYTNPTVINNMLSHSLQWLTEQGDDGMAWDKLFRHFNTKVNGMDIGYQDGEEIAIKINMNNYGLDTKIDATPQLVYSLLCQLVYKAGVPQSAITVYDAIRPVTTIYDRCHAEFPAVNFNSSIVWVSGAISYSAQVTDPEARKIPQCVLNTKYLINMAILKKHDLRTAVTLCGKNHFGSIASPSALHPYVMCWQRGMGSYDPQVDLMGGKFLGAKTLLYMIDGLYGAKEWDAVPSKWTSVPFSNDWPSSIFVSQDPVAIDSVGIDFLRTECSLQNYADNYLHEAALANNPPSGVFYDPEGDGTRLQNLGVHEHWNNAVDKKYSRNLGTGEGIELLDITPQTGGYYLIGDFNSDGLVNDIDLKLLTDQWLIQQGGANWDSRVDIAPVGGDGKIDFQDFISLSADWSKAL